jgi:hypothetical protein
MSARDYRDLVIEGLADENRALEDACIALTADRDALRQTLHAAVALLATVADERDQLAHQLRQKRRAHRLAVQAENEATQAA